MKFSLRERGWLSPSGDQTSTARFAPFVMTSVISAFGAVKVAVRINRGKPVGFLIVGVIVTFIIALAFLSKPQITHAAKRWLKERREQLSMLKDVRSLSNPTSQEVALATALFGSVVLRGTVCEPLQAAWRQNRSAFGSSGCGTGGCGTSGGGCRGCAGGGD